MKQNQKDLASLPLFADDYVFGKACKSVAGISAMFNDAKAAGYHIVERWRWRTGSMNRHGIVRVEDAHGEVVWLESWDVGSTRMPSDNFRITSRHGRCLIAALTFVRTKVLGELHTDI